MSAPRARIVLADDNKPFAAACRLLLSGLFDFAAVVHDGNSAFEAVAAHDPDVLVLDISMPDMTGIEVLEKLARDTRVVILTIHQGAALADRAVELGAYGYVTKARMARDLPTAIQDALAGIRFRSPVA
ncbi:MAG: response regulator [Planctomycetota bacterium]|jgi:DNA-binding NarL/FixJ family response regulator